MTFIKKQNVVINTSYVAAVRLDNQTIAVKKNVSVLLAALQFLLFSRIRLFKILTINNGILDFATSRCAGYRRYEIFNMDFGF
jgi:hypothetical protein